MNRALKWRLFAGFALVFIAGGMTGALVGAAHARHMFFQGQPGSLSERMRRHLRTQLHLSKEQVAQVSPVIDKTAAQLEEIHGTTGERVRDAIAQEHREITPYLSDEQRARLKQLEQRAHHWQPFRAAPRRSPAQQREL
jgi:gas vesicle protein